MSDSQLLSQDEIDALLRGDRDPAEDLENETSAPNITLYDPTKQHRVIRERLDALEIINERFARSFRQSLFNLIRKTTDITVQSVKITSFSEFSRNIPSPSNLNLISMKPLKGNALVVFPPAMIYMVVEQLYGGDGKSAFKAEGREFTPTEQRVIRRTLKHAIESYQSAWSSVFNIDIEYVRSEMQPRFVNLTNSQNEMIVNTTFNFEVGNFPGEFNIALPYLMIEPIKGLLNGPLADTYPEDEQEWSRKIEREIKEAEVNVSVDFAEIQMTMSELMGMSPGDMVSIDMPKLVQARVQGIPVFDCNFGERNGKIAVRVNTLANHYKETVQKLASE